MKIIKMKTGCLCHNCDINESEFVISSENGNSFKVFWAKEEYDCEIAFCKTCAEELFCGLRDALNVE